MEWINCRRIGGQVSRHGWSTVLMVNSSHRLFHVRRIDTYLSGKLRGELNIYYNGIHIIKKVHCKRMMFNSSTRFILDRPFGKAFWGNEKVQSGVLYGKVNICTVLLLNINWHSYSLGNRFDEFNFAFINCNFAFRNTVAKGCVKKRKISALFLEPLLLNKMGWYPASLCH